MADKISTNDLKSQKSDFVIIDVRESDELVKEGFDAVTLEGGYTSWNQ